MGIRSDPSLRNVKPVVDTAAPVGALRHTRRRKQEQSLLLRRARAAGGSVGAMTREEAMERSMAMKTIAGGGGGGRRHGSRERSGSHERGGSRERGDALAPQLLELLQPDRGRQQPRAPPEEALVQARQQGDDRASLDALKALVCRELVVAQVTGEAELSLQRLDVQGHISSIVVLSNAYAMAQLHGQVTENPKEREDSASVAQLLRLADALTKRQFLPADVAQRLRAVTLNNMGCFSRHRGRHHAALKYLKKALELELNRFTGAEGSGVGGDPGGTHLNLCATLSSLGRHREAAEQAEMAIDSLFASLPRTATASSADGVVYYGAHSVPLECGDTAALLSVAYSNLASEQESIGSYESALVSIEHAMDFADRFTPEDQHVRAELSERREAVQRLIAAEGRRRSNKAAGNRGRSGAGTAALDASAYLKDPEEENRHPGNCRASRGSVGLKPQAPAALLLPALNQPQGRAASALGLVDSGSVANGVGSSGPSLRTSMKFFNNAMPVNDLTAQRPQSYSAQLPALYAPAEGPAAGISQPYGGARPASRGSAGSATSFQPQFQQRDLQDHLEQEQSPVDAPANEIASVSLADLSSFPASFGFAPAAAPVGSPSGGGPPPDHRALLTQRPSI